MSFRIHISRLLCSKALRSIGSQTIEPGNQVCSTRGLMADDGVYRDSEFES